MTATLRAQNEFPESQNRSKIKDLRAAYKAALDEIRGSVGLSELGKQQLMARAYLNTRAEMDRLGQIDLDADISRFNSLERQVFGNTAAATGADAISFRDATERAGKLKSADTALAMLGSAELSGDTTLAKAILLHSWQKGWASVTDQYALNHPRTTDKLLELKSLRERLSRRASTRGYIVGSVAAGLIPPTELQNLSPGELEEYAAAEPEKTLAAVQAARMRGEATPDQEEAARKRAVEEARARAGLE